VADPPATDGTRELFLIDGNSLVYRAFFALPETIATSKGFPTNAIFGFASMLVKILTEYGPKPTLVVWDAGMSGRDEVSADYKAGRRSRPDMLMEQWPHMAPLVDAFGYTNVKVDGFEADDVIATLAGRAKQHGVDVMVVTGDRDMFQLIEDGVKVMATSRGITETKIYDEQAVIDRYGIGPELIPDFYGLKGDTSDNIPGVPGIGDKTASDLLQKFGTLDNVLASIDEISGAKRKENLTNHADDARMSKQLATAVRDVPVDVDIEHCMAREPDRVRLREVFREFELRDPLRRLEEAMGDEEIAAPRERAALVIEARAQEVPAAEIGRLGGSLLTLAAERPLLDGSNGATPAAGASADRSAEEELVESLAEGEAAQSELEALDAELDAELTLAAEEPQAEESPPAPKGDSAQLGLGDADGGLRSSTLRFAAYGGGDEVLVGEAETLAALALSWGDRPIVAHDWKSIASAEDPSIAPPLEHDTMVAAYLIDPARRGYPLAELAEQEGLAANVTGGDELAESAVITRVIAERQRERLEEEGLTRLFEDVELPLVDVLVEMQRHGLKLDTKRLAEIGRKVEARITELESEIHSLAGEEFTIGSPQQLSHILFDVLGLTKKRRGKTGFSTDARVLQAIRSEHEIIPKIEEWREYSKLKSTYLDALPELISPQTGRLHTTFNQTATTTGRLSSTDPNLQNIPIRTELGREIRSCFVAEPGNKLVSADYSQVELRILSHISGEQVLRDIFARGEDVHTATAGEIFGVTPDQVDPGLRSKAKMVNFGIVYGLSAFGLADRLDIPQEEAQEFIDRYLGRFPKVKQFIDDTIESAKESGYVKTLFGRMRRIPELRARQRQTRMLGERLAVNTVIQGTAADIIKVAMVRSRAAVADAGLSARLVLQIHDELLFEAPEHEADQVAEIVRREMVAACDLDPPLAVDVGIGDNWLAAK
jgi:DNA polymerase-1